MRRRTDGIVTMVGPMSKRKPSPRKLRGFAAEPFVAFEERDLMSARRQDAGGGKPAEAAPDDANGFHELFFWFLILPSSAPIKSRSARKRVRLRPCTARM